MAGHYFKTDYELADQIKEIKLTFSGKEFRFFTTSGIFSKNNLDYGTEILLKSLELEDKGTLLDLGCGYGPVGIILKKIYPNLEIDQTDVNERAVKMAQKNSTFNNVKTNVYCSDGFENITKKFNVVVLNPPIRAGKEVVFSLYNQVYDNLEVEGLFYIVVRNK